MPRPKPTPPPTPRPPLTTRQRVNRELRGPVRLALLGPERPLPTERWKRVHARRGHALGLFPALCADAGVRDLPTALRRLADVLDATKRAA